MKTDFRFALYLLALVTLVGCASPLRDTAISSQVYRVPCRVTSPSHDLQIFIATGSLAHPIVTLADNEGYPAVLDLYARPAALHGQHGLHVTVRFMGPAKGREFSLNVLQEGMTRDFQVMPFSQ